MTAWVIAGIKALEWLGRFFTFILTGALNLKKKKKEKDRFNIANQKKRRSFFSYNGITNKNKPNGYVKISCCHACST